MSTEIVLYTVYGPSREFPRHYVVRRWRLDKLIDDKYPFIIAPTLEEARAGIPPGLARIPREELDDPAVLESWI